MRFTVCDINEAKFYKRTKNLKLLEDFRDSGAHCARVEDWSNKNNYVCARSLNGSIKRFRFSNFKAIARNGEVYLINEEAKK